jgi:sarcosine oxidase subunit alpha
VSGYRIPGRGRVDPAQPLSFSFDGKPMRGLAGDTLASALLASGTSLVARSFKYHRPRGVLGAGVEEPNALMGVDRGAGRYTPNARATGIELHDGLRVETQNRWPSLGFDLGAATNALSPLFPAGFYNKTFMWPRAAWEKLYEPAIRRMAGLGKAPDAIDADRYTATYDFVDLLVVGAGRAGIEAALAASASGERIMIIDEQNELGGKLLAEPARWEWLDGALRARSACRAPPRSASIMMASSARSSG